MRRKNKEMNRIDGLSLNLERNNIEKIKELFPEAVEEGKIDFDMLRAMLGDEVDDSKEKYQFTWNGKAKSIKLAQTPSYRLVKYDLSKINFSEKLIKRRWRDFY